LVKKCSQEERAMTVLLSTGATLVPETTRKETQKALGATASKNSAKAHGAVGEARVAGGLKLAAENEARFSKGPCPPAPTTTNKPDDKARRQSPTKH
jgi:hypothetical protein